MSVLRAGRSFKPQNRVIIAGSGQAHPNLQAAVTAAEQDCGYNQEYTIYVAPDADQTHMFSDERNRQFVHIVPVAERGRRDGVLDAIPGEIQVTPFVTKGPALLCIRVDDGDDAILQTFSALGGKSPADYARDKGILLDLAVNTEFFGETNDPTKLTPDECKILYYRYGFNINSHAHKHNTNPSNRELVEMQVAKSVSILRNLQDSSGNHIGLPALGWVQPGNWDNQYSMLTLNAAYSHLGTSVRQWCAYSDSYLGNQYSARRCFGLPMQRHFRSSFAAIASTSNHSNDVARVNRLLHAASEPGNRVVFYIHKVTSSYNSNYPYWITADLFKHIIDELATTWRNKIQTCSMDAINFAMIIPPMYTSAGTVEVMGPGWHFENISTEMLEFYSWSQGFYLEKQTGDSITIESGGSGLHQYPDTKHLLVLRTSTSGNVMVTFQAGLRHGVHMLEFEAQQAGFTGPATMRVVVYFYKPPYSKATSQGEGVYAFERNFVPTSSWTKFYLPFGVPTWASDTRIFFYAQPVSSGEERGFRLNNVEIWPL